MKMENRPRVLMKPAILLLLLFATISLGATDQPTIDPSDDFSPMCFAFVLIAFCVVAFLVIVSIASAAISVACAAILIGLGILSSAALVGVLRRRFSSGLRALHYQICAVAGLPVGVATLWLGSLFFSAHLRHRDIFLVGSIAGIFSGLILAFAFDRLASIIYHRLVIRPTPNTTGNC